jgi:hypothetical protein
MNPGNAARSASTSSLRACNRDTGTLLYPKFGERKVVHIMPLLDCRSMLLWTGLLAMSDHLPIDVRTVAAEDGAAHTRVRSMPRVIDCGRGQPDHAVLHPPPAEPGVLSGQICASSRKYSSKRAGK